MILGLVGGIGSGKSTVAGCFADLGCEVVDADEIAHRALSTESVKERIRSRFGAGVFTDGEVDRRALARVVFDGEAGELEALNGIVHPPVREEIRDRVAAFRDAPESAPALILDVPLLASSAELRALCDAVIFVDADESVRLRRVRGRGWSDDELARRERHQAMIEDKRALARWHIDNSGSLDATREAVRSVLREAPGTFTDPEAGPKHGPIQKDHPER